MTDEDSLLDAKSRERSRSLASSVSSASRWRDKLREKAGKLAKGSGRPTNEEQANAVSDFLHSGAESSSSAKPASLGLQIPTDDKLDPAAYAPTPKFSFRKRTKAKKFSVTFSEKEPDIIGEGGDICETPAKNVIGSWKGRQASPRSSNELVADKLGDIPPSLASPSFKSLSPLSAVGDAPDKRQSFLQRTPTRKPVGGWEQRRLSMNMEEGLVQAHKRDESDGELPQKLDVPVLPPGPMTLEGHEYQAIQQPYRTHRTSQEMLLPQFLDTRQPTIPQINGPQSGGQFVPFNPSMPKAAPPTSRSPQPERPRSRQKFDEQQGDEMHLAVEKRPAPYPEKDSGYTRTRSATAGVPSTAASSQETLVPDIHLHDVDGNVIGQPESEDFYSRVQHLRGVFRLAAEKSNDIENKALEFWLRMTAWWFLKGKSALEKSTKPSNQPDASRAGPGRTGQQSQQCYVDLAKAWWAMEDIIPDLVSPHSPVSIRNGLDKFDGLDYPQLLGVYHLIQANMHGFAIFMKRNNLLPPPALLIQGADPCIWIEYPALPQGTLCLTAGLDPRTLIKRTRRPFFPILFGDTERHFNYGRLFAEAEIVSDDGVAEDSQLPCIISIIRERTSSQVEITIVSQDGQINLHVQSDPKLGPTWKDVEWKVKAHSIRIRLSRDFEVALRLWDEDFRTLWGIDDYTRRVEADWQPEEHEDIVFDNKINVFHYAGPPQKSGNFPSFPITNCSVRLFKRSIIRVEGSAQRKLFDGVRFVVMTPPSSKILSSISRVFAKEAPILFSNLRGEKEAPALLLAIRESDEKTSLILTFEDAAQRADFHMLLSGIAAEPDEQTSNDIPLESMFVEDLFPSSSQVSRAHPLASSMQWKSARVISQGPREGLNHIMHSDRLRVRLSCSFGTIVDLINLGTGELQISLDSEDTRLIKLYRPAQDNLILSFAHNLYPKEEHGALQQTLQSTKEVPTARVYKFPVLKAMHDFQQLVTGFDVMYDGIATMFSISHRMNMIPIYKKQEATHARLQVLSYDNMGMRMIQLIIVLKDFPNGRIMNFQLRSTDTFETMSKSGKHCVRFDDAKFALPKQQDNQEMAWDYVCLDTPEYPGEHDDIVVGFDTEEERDNLARVLPAPPTKASRMQSFRK